MVTRAALGVLFIVLVLSATASSEETDSAPDRMLFESRFENHAWGYYGYECRIMSSGKIERYSIEKKVGRFEMVKDYTELPPGRIDPEIVETMAEKISAAKGEPGESIYMANDYGTGQLVAMDYSQDSENVEKILLIEWGDFGRVNPSEAAVELATWLSEVFSNAGCRGPEDSGGRLDPRKYPFEN